MSILIDKDTTFIVQGITGREAVNLTRENLDYGARIVGGVTPGRAGRDVYGVPVYDCVRDITSRQKVDGADIAAPEAWLVTACSRRCIDMLREARRQRETYVGPWLPEPASTNRSFSWFAWRNAREPTRRCCCPAEW